MGHENVKRRKKVWEGIIISCEINKKKIIKKIETMLEMSG